MRHSFTRRYRTSPQPKASQPRSFRATPTFIAIWMLTPLLQNAQAWALAKPIETRAKAPQNADPSISLLTQQHALHLPQPARRVCIGPSLATQRTGTLASTDPTTSASLRQAALNPTDWCIDSRYPGPCLGPGLDRDGTLWQHVRAGTQCHALYASANERPPLRSMPPDVRYEARSTRRICQLLGDTDRRTQTPAHNRTESRFGLWSTDLGASFEHKGKLHLLFGDVWQASRVGRPVDSDAIATSEDTNADDCIDLRFLTSRDGYYQPLTIPGVSLAGYEVPSGGVSLGKSMLIYVTTDYRAGLMGRSVVAQSLDDGAHWQRLFDLSRSKFINIQPKMIHRNTLAPDELPSGSTPEALLLWGSGSYRTSSPVLAVQDPGSAQDPRAIRYFAGMSPVTNRPIWSTREAEASALFEHPCVGEFSVSYIPSMSRWLMLYNCGAPRGITFRTAPKPWGPWSEGQVLLEPWLDGAYCDYMHASNAWLREQNRGPCDQSFDPSRENEWGGEYGPYLIDRYLRDLGGGRVSITFLLSTWNPYNVMVMQSTLRLQGGGEGASVGIRKK